MTATDEVSYVGSPGPAVRFFASVNAIGADTLSIAWALTDGGGDGGDNGANLYIIDPDTGIVLNNQSDIALSGTFTWTVDYSGYFLVVIDIFGKYADAATPPISIDTSAVITSSGTMSVNPIQAKWDGGLTCANLLNCGDTCP